MTHTSCCEVCDRAPHCGVDCGSCNPCAETYESMNNFRTEVWWLSCSPTKVERAKSRTKRTTLGRVNFAHPYWFQSQHWHDAHMAVDEPKPIPARVTPLRNFKA